MVYVTSNIYNTVAGISKGKQTVTVHMYAIAKARRKNKNPLDNDAVDVVVYWLVRQDLLTVTQAALAQLVERILGKDEVSSPNLPSSF